MTAMIDTSNNRANIAFAGEVPWHGLGSVMQPGMSEEQWIQEAGLQWTALRSGVHFYDADDIQHTAPDQVLYRSDTKMPLGVVTNRYKIVQPREVVEFYRDLVATQGWTLDVCGSLDGGKRIWALAKTDAEIVVGNGMDIVETYLLLATAFDGTMATIGKFSSVRVVCSNTLTMSLNDDMAKVKVPHSRVFDPMAVKEELGIYAAATSKLEEEANRLAKRKVSDSEAAKFIAEVIGGKDFDAADVSARQGNIIKGVIDLYRGNGMGSDFSSAAGTAWGLVNSITQYVDWEINSRNNNNRMRSAWFGQGDKMKTGAFEKALALCE